MTEEHSDESAHSETKSKAEGNLKLSEEAGLREGTFLVVLLLFIGVAALGIIAIYATVGHTWGSERHTVSERASGPVKAAAKDKAMTRRQPWELETSDPAYKKHLPRKAVRRHHGEISAVSTGVPGASPVHGKGMSASSAILSSRFITGSRNTHGKRISLANVAVTTRRAGSTAASSIPAQTSTGSTTSVRQTSADESRTEEHAIVSSRALTESRSATAGSTGHVSHPLVDSRNSVQDGTSVRATKLGTTGSIVEALWNGSGKRAAGDSSSHGGTAHSAPTRPTRTATVSSSSPSSNRASGTRKAEHRDPIIRSETEAPSMQSELRYGNRSKAVSAVPLGTPKPNTAQRSDVDDDMSAPLNLILILNKTRGAFRNAKNDIFAATSLTNAAEDNKIASLFTIELVTPLPLVPKKAVDGVSTGRAGVQREGSAVGRITGDEGEVDQRQQRKTTSSSLSQTTPSALKSDPTLGENILSTITTSVYHTTADARADVILSANSSRYVLTGEPEYNSTMMINSSGYLAAHESHVGANGTTAGWEAPVPGRLSRDVLVKGNAATGASTGDLKHFGTLKAFASDRLEANESHIGAGNATDSPGTTVSAHTERDMVVNGSVATHVFTDGSRDAVKMSPDNPDRLASIQPNVSTGQTRYSAEGTAAGQNESSVTPNTSTHVPHDALSHVTGTKTRSSRHNLTRELLVDALETTGSSLPIVPGTPQSNVRENENAAARDSPGVPGHVVTIKTQGPHLLGGSEPHVTSSKSNVTSQRITSVQPSSITLRENASTRTVRISLEHVAGVRTGSSDRTGNNQQDVGITETMGGSTRVAFDQTASYAALNAHDSTYAASSSPRNVGRIQPSSPDLLPTSILSDNGSQAASSAALIVTHRPHTGVPMNENVSISIAAGNQEETITMRAGNPVRTASSEDVTAANPAIYLGRTIPPRKTEIDDTIASNNGTASVIPGDSRHGARMGTYGQEHSVYSALHVSAGRPTNDQMHTTSSHPQDNVTVSEAVLTSTVHQGNTEQMATVKANGPVRAAPSQHVSASDATSGLERIPVSHSRNDVTLTGAGSTYARISSPGYLASSGLHADAREARNGSKDVLPDQSGSYITFSENNVSLVTPVQRGYAIHVNANRSSQPATQGPSDDVGNAHTWTNADQHNPGSSTESASHVPSKDMRSSTHNDPSRKYESLSDLTKTGRNETTASVLSVTAAPTGQPLPSVNESLFNTKSTGNEDHPRPVNGTPTSSQPSLTTARRATFERSVSVGNTTFYKAMNATGGSIGSQHEVSSEWQVSSEKAAFEVRRLSSPTLYSSDKGRNTGADKTSNSTPSDGQDRSTTEGPRSGKLAIADSVAENVPVNTTVHWVPSLESVNGAEASMPLRGVTSDTRTPGVRRSPEDNLTLTEHHPELLPEEPVTALRGAAGPAMELPEDPDYSGDDDEDDVPLMLRSVRDGPGGSDPRADAQSRNDGFIDFGAPLVSSKDYNDP